MAEEIEIREDEAQAETDAGASDDAEVKEAHVAGEPHETRKERKAARGKIVQERDEYRREVERLRQELAASETRMASALANLGENTAGIARAVEKVIPRGEDPRIALKKRLADTASRIRSDDPGSADAFLDAQLEAAEKIAEARAAHIVDERLREFSRSQPAPPTPAQTVYLSLAPWLTDPNANIAVESEIHFLARGRDMSNLEVRDKTIREAIVSVGTRHKLPLNMPAPMDGNGAARVSGSGSRTGGGAPEQGAVFDLTPAMQASLDYLSARNPEWKKLSKDARIKRFREEIVEPGLSRK